MSVDGGLDGPKPSRAAGLTRGSIKTQLFLASYAPLFTIMAVRFDALTLRLGCAGLALAGTASAVSVLGVAARRKAPVTVTLDRVDDVGGEVSGYLATYLLPFVVVAQPSVRDVIAYLIYLAVAMVIYLRSDLIRVNPLLYVLGYRVSGVDAGPRSGYLISKDPVRAGDSVSVVELPGVWLTVSR